MGGVAGVAEEHLKQLRVLHKGVIKIIAHLDR